LLVVIAFLVMLAMVGWHYMGLQSFQKSPSLRISMGLVYAVMPVCAVLMAALSALDLFRLLRGGETRRHAAPEAME
jgi:TRAP-type C4-dicarboxylate transport system permease small subunit